MIADCFSGLNPTWPSSLTSILGSPNSMIL
nr:MAG TPA: hypothetical protein [Inoviridae sp.]